MSITDGLTIGGPGDNRLTVSGNDASCVFNISGNSSNVEIDDLTIAHVPPHDGSRISSPCGT